MLSRKPLSAVFGRRSYRNRLVPNNARTYEPSVNHHHAQQPPRIGRASLFLPTPIMSGVPPKKRKRQKYVFEVSRDSPADRRMAREMTVNATAGTRRISVATKSAKAAPEEPQQEPESSEYAAEAAGFDDAFDAYGNLLPDAPDAPDVPAMKKKRVRIKVRARLLGDKLDVGCTDAVF